MRNEEISFICQNVLERFCVPLFTIFLSDLKNLIFIKNLREKSTYDVNVEYRIQNYATDAHTHTEIKKKNSKFPDYVGFKTLKSTENYIYSVLTKNKLLLLKEYIHLQVIKFFKVVKMTMNYKPERNVMQNSTRVLLAVIQFTLKLNAIFMQFSL